MIYFEVIAHAYDPRKGKYWRKDLAYKKLQYKCDIIMEYMKLPSKFF